MTSKPKHYDAIIIGTGQGGVPLAKALAGAGWKTAVLEKKYVGGTCINFGCTPTKTMVASARVAYLARRAADYGVRTGRVGVDLRRVRQRKRDIVHSFRNGTESGLEETKNVELLFGTAAFSDRKTVSLRPHGGGATRTLTADVIVINTGCRPRSLSIPGIDQVRTLDSTSIMELARVPAHLVVLGGGYIAVEFGQMFRRFGSKVTVIERGSHLLGREDEDVANGVAEILREDGLEILFESELESVAKQGRGRLALSVRVKRRRRRIIADELLVATGRIPNTD